MPLIHSKMMLKRMRCPYCHWLFLLCAGISLVVFTTAYAQLFEGESVANEIILVIGEVQPLPVKNPQQVKIGNPAIFDVTNAGQQELLLSGLAEGETTLTIVDAYGKRQYVVQVFTEDLEKTKERIDILLETAGYDTVKTRIGYKERKIFLTGTLAETEQQDFQTMIAPLQGKVVDLIAYEEALSVEIDVEVLEIGKTDLDNLGLEWNKSVLFEEGGVAGGTITGAPYDLWDPTQFFKIMKDWRTGTIRATLNFLKQNNKARTLSRPKIVCLSGKEAKLLVGGERPIITGSTTTAGSGSSTQTFDVELKEYGIELSIKPTVKKDNEISVELKTEITEVDDANAIALSASTTTPGFTKRSAETELSVLDGQTIFLAGLISSKRTDNRDSVQGLGKIPILGALFRHRNLSQRDTEVVITLTPTVLRTKRPAYAHAAASTTIITGLGTAPLTGSADTTPKPLSADDELVQSYSHLVKNIIHSNVSYPASLQGKSIKGAVKLSLHVQSSGKLLGVVIMQSSGNQVLDDLAEHTVKKLSPFPAFPKDLKLKELWIDMPIVYKLDEST